MFQSRDCFVRGRKARVLITLDFLTADPLNRFKVWVKGLCRPAAPGGPAIIEQSQSFSAGNMPMKVERENKEEI